MYELLEPAVSNRKLGCWAKPLERFSDVVGYSSFGVFFLRDPHDSTYLVLYPLRIGSNAKRYGPFESVEEFEAAVLKEPSFVAEVLRPTDLDTLSTLVGSLGDEQVYIPEPYPFLGGSGALASYSRGNVWVFADLVGQTLGIGS